MRYKLIATDLDGTLFGRDLTVSERNRRAILRAREQGAHFVIATGRMFRSTLPYAQELDVATPLITYQGALIRNHQTLEDLWHRTVPSILAREALDALLETGLHVNLYVNDELLIDRLSPEAELYCQVSRVSPTIVQSLYDVLVAEPTKLVAIGTVEQIDHWVPRLKERFGARLYVTKSYPLFVEIAHPTIKKSVALAHVAERLGIAPDEIVAFGDGLNDLDMISYAGLGVAMGNGPEELKAIAGHVTKRVDEDGVACVLEELFAD